MGVVLARVPTSYVTSFGKISPRGTSLTLKNNFFSPPFCSSTETMVVSLGETGLLSFMGFVVQWLFLIGQGLIFRERSTNGANGSHTRKLQVKKVVLVYGFCKQRLIRSLMELLVFKLINGSFFHSYFHSFMYRVYIEGNHHSKNRKE